MVGLTEDQAIEKYGKENILIGRNSFTGNGRAIASNEAHGFVKVIADKNTMKSLVFISSVQLQLK